MRNELPLPCVAAAFAAVPLLVTFVVSGGGDATCGNSNCGPRGGKNRFDPGRANSSSTEKLLCADVVEKTDSGRVRSSL